MTGRSDKWAALLIFVKTGTFADEEDFGMWAALAGNGSCAGFAEVTLDAH